jgi:hypothetical protein
MSVSDIAPGRDIAQPHANQAARFCQDCAV